MDQQTIAKKLKKLNELIEDYLDNVAMNEADEQAEKEDE